MWHQPPRLSVPGDVESRTTEVAGPSVTAACSPPVPGIQHGSNLVRDLRGLVSRQRSRRPYPRASRSRSSDGRSSSRPRGPSAQSLSRLPTRAEIWALELTEPTFDTGPAYIGRSGILRRRVGPAPGNARGRAWRESAVDKDVGDDDLRPDPAGAEVCVASGGRTKRLVFRGRRSVVERVRGVLGGPTLTAGTSRAERPPLRRVETPTQRAERRARARAARGASQSTPEAAAATRRRTCRARRRTARPW